MASAVQPQIATRQTGQLHAEREEAASVPMAGAELVARLDIVADPTRGILIDLPDAAAPGIEETPRFIRTRDVRQRHDGRTAAIIGEPGVVVDSSTGVTRRVDADELLDLYATLGKDCVGKLLGNWAIVIVDPGLGRTLLANDRMGRQPLYFGIEGDSVLIGSSLGKIKEVAGETGLDPQALYHYLYFHMVPAPGSVMEGFQKLGAASLLELSAEGHDSSVYWVPSFAEKAYRPVASAQAELRLRLKTAVERCAVDPSRGQVDVDEAATRGKIGAFLSGGLDSSTVAGMLSEIQGGGCDAYAIGFDADGYDEMPYARVVARHFGIRLHEHYVTPDEVVAALPEVAAAFDQPFGNSSALPAYFCARMAAEDGVDVLLAGDGGDELFAGNERYAGQKIFEDYAHVPRLLRTSVIEPLLSVLPGVLPLVPKARSFIRQANTPLPGRLQHYGFLEQNSPDDVFTPGFMKQVDRARPQSLLNEIYQRPGKASVLNRMLFLDWQITLADNDLRKVSQACALAGVTARYPMLDDELVEFSTRIPSAWKLPGGRSRGRKLRHFYKQGLTGWLPEATINKRKHGFGLPFGVWMKNHTPLQELACDSITNLKKRGIFLPRFLDQAIASHREGHAAYFGELIWVLTSLELWLAANDPGYQYEQNP